MKLITLPLTCLGAFFILSFAKPQLREFKIAGEAQGTTYAVSYYATDSLVSKHQIDSVLKVIDLSMSLYKSDSKISQFNRAPHGLVLDSHFLRVVKRSMEIYKDTKGIFDITVEPLVKYWTNAKREPNTADSASIKQLLPNVGMDKLELKGNYLAKKKPGIHLDVNGIAQGYSVDVVADFLAKHRIAAYVVEIGGEIRMKGPKPDGKPMRIGIEGPDGEQATAPAIKHVLAANEGAITTSGNYRKYLEVKRMSYLINPKTGFPLDGEIISVTVYAKDAITADGYDNALMAMKVNDALAFVNSHKELEAYFIYKTSTGKLADTASIGFKKMLVN